VTDDKETANLDLSIIRFPTDQVTIGQLRREHPRLLADWNALGKTQFCQMNITATMMGEMALAEKAFAAAAGEPDPHPDNLRLEQIRYLDMDYRRYGISRGYQESLRLASDIEKAAETQAMGRSGRAR